MIRRIPKTIEDFAWIKWGPETIRRVAREILDKKKEIYEKIKSIPTGERTFENTIYALERAGDIMAPDNYFDILFYTSPDPDIRQAAEEVSRAIKRENIEMEYDERIYNAFKEYADKKEKLEGQDAELFKDLAVSYKRMGFELPSDKRDKVKENLKLINDLSQDFISNSNKYDDFILVTREELDGLPDHYIDGLQKAGDKYKVSLQYPEFGPFMDHATHASKRKELAHKNYLKGGEKNLEIAYRIMELRKETSSLLGYESYTDFAAETRMAKNLKTINNFLSKFIEKIQLSADKNLQELIEAKRKDTKNPNAVLDYYDTSFYWSKLQKERFDFDDEQLRPFFELSHVLDRMFFIYGTLFSIKFKPRPDIPSWHTDVKWYEVSELNDDHVGYVFFDLFPRDNKYTHFACFYAVVGRETGFKSGEFISPVSGVVGNFNKPTSERPSLLIHQEVSTLFHEFGHVVDTILQESRYSSLATFAWDFIEVPSQLMEHWVWDPEIIKDLSEHYETKEKLSDDLIDRIIKARYHLYGRFLMSQSTLGLLDIEMHGKSFPEDMPSFYCSLVEKYSHVKPPADNLFPALFGHFIGYAGAYYSYLWSEVICADFFKRFKERGLLNPEIGREYREKVLKFGGSRDEVETVRDFLGRDFSEDAYLEEVGLKK